MGILTCWSCMSSYMQQHSVWPFQPETRSSLLLHLCVCVCVCVRAYMCVCAPVCPSMWSCLCVCVCVCARARSCVPICPSVWSCVRGYVCVQECVHIYLSICVKLRAWVCVCAGVCAYLPVHLCEVACVGMCACRSVCVSTCPSVWSCKYEQPDDALITILRWTQSNCINSQIIELRIPAPDILNCEPSSFMQSMFCTSLTSSKHWWIHMHIQKHIYLQSIKQDIKNIPSCLFSCAI